MKIIDKINGFEKKVVEVQPYEPVYTLWNKLNIPREDTRFQFRGMSYDMNSFKTFAEIGIKDGDRIVLLPLVMAGGGHICPYGCGRIIPDEYKGCTELLQERPNYFNYTLLKKINRIIIILKNHKFIVIKNIF